MGVWAEGGNGKKAATWCRSSWAFPGPTFPYNTLRHRVTRNVVPHSACVKRALNGPGHGSAVSYVHCRLRCTLQWTEENPPHRGGAQRRAAPPPGKGSGAARKQYKGRGEAKGRAWDIREACWRACQGIARPAAL